MLIDRPVPWSSMEQFTTVITATQPPHTRRKIRVQTQLRVLWIVVNMQQYKYKY